MDEIKKLLGIKASCDGRTFYKRNRIPPHVGDFDIAFKKDKPPGKL